MEYPHGRIARTVEREAAKRFGPEGPDGLEKIDVADALNVSEDSITDEEWAEISEFAVNAGARLIRSAIREQVPSAIAEGKIDDLRYRIKSNQDGLAPFHDLFHAAETYRLTHGKSASAEFIEIDKRGRFTNPVSAVAELYPVLFLTLPVDLDAPLPVLLSTADGRKSIARFLSKSFDRSLPGVEEAITHFQESDSPETPEARRKEYEKLVELIVVSNAQRKLAEMKPPLKPMTSEERDAMHKAFEAAAHNPPAHYQQFAEKVFAQTDFNKVPRLFLDELLACIRVKVKDEN